MCCEPIDARPEDTVGRCPKCGEHIDSEGKSTLRGCHYSPVVCDECGDKPCDLSC